MKQSPKNRGAKGSKVSGSKREPVKDETPVLEDLGIDKKLSSRAQVLATVPIKQFEAALVVEPGG